MIEGLSTEKTRYKLAAILTSNLKFGSTHPHAMTSPPFFPAAGRLQPGHVCVNSLVSGWSSARCISFSRCRSRTVRSRLRCLLCVASGIERVRWGRGYAMLKESCLLPTS